MNKIIYKLFSEVYELEEELDGFKKAGISDSDHSVCIAKYGITWRKEVIADISSSLNPQIPEPYASMSHDEILERIGQYEVLCIRSSTCSS